MARMLLNLSESAMIFARAAAAADPLDRAQLARVPRQAGSPQTRWLSADQLRHAHAEALAERFKRHAAVLHHVVQRGRGQHLRVVRPVRAQQQKTTSNEASIWLIK